MPESEMSAPAFALIEAHDTRISRLEDESRDSNSKLAEHTVGLQHLAKQLDEKISDVQSDIAEVRSDFKESIKDLKDTLGQQIGGLGTHVEKAMETVQDTAARLKQFEDARDKSRAIRKWIIVSLGSVVVSGATYVIQQILSKLTHH